MWRCVQAGGLGPGTAVGATHQSGTQTVHGHGDGPLSSRSGPRLSCWPLQGAARAWPRAPAIVQGVGQGSRDGRLLQDSLTAAARAGCVCREVLPPLGGAAKKRGGRSSRDGRPVQVVVRRHPTSEGWPLESNSGTRTNGVRVGVWGSLLVVGEAGAMADGWTWLSRPWWRLPSCCRRPLALVPSPQLGNSQVPFGGPRPTHSCPMMAESQAQEACWCCSCSCRDGGWMLLCHGGSCISGGEPPLRAPPTNVTRAAGS